MMKVHEKLTDIKQIKAHNQIKETKLKVCVLGSLALGSLALALHSSRSRLA